jgi:Zn-dependent protease with chaperone function
VQQSSARRQRAQSTERPGWRLKLPEAPLRLDDDRLLEYRHPTELPMLCLSLVILAVLLVGAAMLKHRVILLGIAGIWLSMIATSLQAVTYNLMRGAEVTPTQFPEIYQIVQELNRRFKAPATRVFVVRQFSAEAEAIGFKAPYAIVLPSLLMDLLEPDQLRYVLGRAVGQIRFGHTRVAILLGGDESTLPEAFRWVARARNLVFAGYRRAQVFSSDRAGILATGVGAAIESQIKISVGNSQLRQVRGDDLIDQAYQLTRGVSRLHAWLITLQSATPPLIYRLRAMVEWAGRPHLDPGMSSHRGAD